MLPYTAEVLDALLADYHAATRPARLLGWLLAALATALAWRGGIPGWRAASGLLGAAWLWTGVVFHQLHFALLNFAAPAYAALFVLQGLLLLTAGALAARIRGAGTGACRGAGITLAVIALLGLPLLALAGGAPVDAVPLAGTAPTPTALLTLGLLLLAARPPLYAFLLPALWGVIAGASGWILGMPREYPLLAAVVLLPWLLWRGRRGE